MSSNFVKIVPLRKGRPPSVGISICFHRFKHSKSNYLLIKIHTDLIKAITPLENSKTVDKVSLSYDQNNPRHWRLSKDDEGHTLSITSRNAVKISLPWDIFEPLESEFKTRKVKYEVGYGFILIDASLPEELQESGETV